jgi:hypothetical protein
MSQKLASGLTEANREALEQLVSMGDTSVPGVEASDINDGDIMANTRERVNGNGQFQFVYIPPDGSDPIESDWISQDHKKKVILGWCEGVKSAIISRGQAGMQAANEAALEAKLKAKREEDMNADTSAKLDAAVPAAQVARTQPAGHASKPATAHSASPSDPGAYVSEQLEIAQEQLNAAQAAQNDINREVIIARKAVEKWTTLARALGHSVGGSDVEQSQPAAPVVSRIHSSPNVSGRTGNTGATKLIRP